MWGESMVRVLRGRGRADLSSVVLRHARVHRENDVCRRIGCLRSVMCPDSAEVPETRSSMIVLISTIQENAGSRCTGL